MTYLKAVLLIVTLVVGGAEATAQLTLPLDPQAAQQYASDSEKAERGDSDAAYRMGEAMESGRLGGVVDLRKALTFYRQAAEQGHREAGNRVAEIESQLGRNAEKFQAAPSGQ